MIELFTILSLILVVAICAQAYLEVHSYGVEARVDTSIGWFGVGTYPSGVYRE